ncbi:MAG: DUF1800 domain-containing protein [Aquabacterium sp.]|uniref:DUF1800 domain-containing protein n=1 Tax=Aquabacterium sp. TaxID=1872578 RepID=UPI003BB0BCB9
MFSLSELSKPYKGLVGAACVSATILITGCGGGGGGDTPTGAAANMQGAESYSVAQGVQVNSIVDGNSTTATTASTPSKPASTQEATRFLTQATFGPTDESVNELLSGGYEAWFNKQASAAPNQYFKGYWEQRNAKLKAQTPPLGSHISELNHAFWTKAITGDDQLRQRIALALSEIFVVSTQDSCGESNTRGVAAYMDMLNARAFGTYRQLLESVTLHPIMGCYLSHLGNQKEEIDPATGRTTGRVPDENYAREVMQLFSIGLVMLNKDGTVKVDAQGQPIETYQASDVAGLARVFTGWSWECPNWPSDSCFRWGGDSATPNPDRWVLQMRPYAKFHSPLEKRFLGTVIPAQTTASPTASLKIALDTIANHPNVAPFISKQLIQRLVTSNPSPAYISRVATVFTSSGGSLFTVAKAILMDAEARDFQTAVNSTKFGKVREPLLRMTALFRAYKARSASGYYLMWSTNDPAKALAQAPLQSPSVFNYFRPQYTPPNSTTSRSGLVSPEMQIVHESSAAGYVNFVRDGLAWGWGACGYSNQCATSPVDIRLDFITNTGNATYQLAKTPAKLVEDVNQRLMYGTMPEDLKTEITQAVSSVWVGADNAPDTAEGYRRRVKVALLLTMASPEFQVQK